MNADRSTRRRTRRLGVSILLVVGALLALGASSALADAGNPIVGTTKADLVQNPNGTVTVYVRGQWNWLSHKSDCNFDRAATGLSMIWNDSTETGYTLNGKTVSAQVGVATKDKSWEDPNPIDGMVHPVDRGNIPEGLPGVTNPPFKVEQTFSDPAPQAAGQPHPTATWRGGCGREPLTHVDAYTNFPWGSWGYEKALESKGTDGNFHQGYSHVYRSRDFVPKSVCVNFYDVHDSGFQVPNNSASLDVLANDDNSIEENDFAVNGGSCVHFVKIKTKATASASLGEPITDTATITDAVTNKTSASDGTITFSAFKDPSTCIGKADFTSGPTAVDLDKSTEVTSEPFSPTSIGTYHWIATFHSTADPQATDITTTCKEAEESSVVGKATPGLATVATTSATVGAKIKDVATISGLVSPTAPFGAVTFTIFKTADCSGSPLATLNATPATADKNGEYTSQEFDTTASGVATYHWIAHYAGDANNKAVDGKCSDPNETTTVNKASPALATTAGPGTVLGGQVTDTAHLSGGTNPTGSITFRLYNNPNCAGTPAAEVTNSSVNGNGDYASPSATPAAAGDYFWVATYSGDANNNGAQTGCSDPTEKVTITPPPVIEVAAAKTPPRECKLRKARARFFIYTRHNKVRLVIRYVAFTKATVTTSFVMHGRKGDLNLGKATKTFNKKGVFRLPKHLTPAKMKKIRAATDFAIQFQIPGTPSFCQRFFKRTLTVARFIEGQKVWFQTGSVFGGDV